MKFARSLLQLKQSTAAVRPHESQPSMLTTVLWFECSFFFFFSGNKIVHDMIDSDSD